MIFVLVHTFRRNKALLYPGNDVSIQYVDEVPWYPYTSMGLKVDARLTGNLMVLTDESFGPLHVPVQVDQTRRHPCRNHLLTPEYNDCRVECCRFSILAVASILY